MKIIGLTGRARSGKDTVANIISDTYRYPAIALADPIKQATYVMLEPFLAHLKDDMQKEKTIPALGVSPREIWQTLGTEWGRQLINENIWLIIAKERISMLEKLGHEGAVITDVRFNNEAEMVRDMGGTVYHVQRDDADEVVKHDSEAGVYFRDGDVAIDNNAGLKELELTVLGTLA